MISELAEFMPLSKPNIICLNEVDHYDDFYKSKLRKLGYHTEVVWRNNKDATLIGWDSKQFKLIKSRNVIHNDLLKKFNFGKDGDLENEFKRGNVGLICLLENV